MSTMTVRALRIALAAGLAGSLVVQAVFVPLLAADLDGAPPAVRWPVVTIVALGVLTVQVTLVCVWRLTALVRRGEVFSPAAFRYVDAITAAAAAAALLLVGLGVVAAPGEAVAPGVVLLLGGAAVLVGGVALLVRLLRALLVQATEMRTELAQVI